MGDWLLPVVVVVGWGWGEWNNWEGVKFISFSFVIKHLGNVILPAMGSKKKIFSL